MKISLQKEERYTVLILEELNLNSLIAPDLKAQFIFLRNEGVRNLILDLSKVKYVDSSGLSAILTANRLWKDYGTFILTGTQAEAVDKLMKISRMDTVLTILPSLDESVDYVMMCDIERELQSDEEE